MNIHALGLKFALANFRFPTLVLSLLLTGVLYAVEEPPSEGRLRATFEGIECEYAPNREALVRSLAHNLAQHNREVAAALALKKSAPVTPLPLSPADLLASRANYLGGIARQLGLAKPTALQEECYDAFQKNYQRTMALYDLGREGLGRLQIIARFTLWDRTELVKRLESGHPVTGFSYDPLTKQGQMNFGFHFNVQDDRFKDLLEERKSLQREYHMSIGQEGGRTVYRGSVSPKKTVPTSQVAAKTIEPDNDSQWLPVVIPAEMESKSFKELAQQLWSGPGERSVSAILGNIRSFQERIPSVDPTIAFIVLHETTELGIVDHYFRGPDRRWFCDGVANYVPWRVTRDLRGEDVAGRLYNRSGQLALYAALREQADLRKWPAAENQADEEVHSELNSARYAFAANAVFLMNERAGPDVLPRLFTEIGRTKPEKVSMKTVEAAWKKVTGTKLDAILAAAVRPIASTTAK